MRRATSIIPWHFLPEVQAPDHGESSVKGGEERVKQQVIVLVAWSES